MEEKKVIRKQVFAARKAHTDQQIDDWSRKIAETVTALPEYSNNAGHLVPAVSAEKKSDTEYNAAEKPTEHYKKLTAFPLM